MPAPYIERSFGRSSLNSFFSLQLVRAITSLMPIATEARGTHLILRIPVTDPSRQVATLDTLFEETRLIHYVTERLRAWPLNATRKSGYVQCSLNVRNV